MPELLSGFLAGVLRGRGAVLRFSAGYAVGRLLALAILRELRPPPRPEYSGMVLDNAERLRRASPPGELSQ